MVSWGCRFWLHILQIVSGSWNAVKYYSFVGLLILASHTADPRWELEDCKIQCFRVVADSGSTYCRSSLGAGTLWNTMVSWGCGSLCGIFSWVVKTHQFSQWFRVQEASAAAARTDEHWSKVLYFIARQLLEGIFGCWWLLWGVWNDVVFYCDFATKWCQWP